MDRKDLIRLYLEAEATCEQERELAQSFASSPPANEEEAAVYQMLLAAEPLQITDLPDGTEEFDRIVRRQKVRRYRTWGFSLAGAAAAVIAVVLLTKKPEEKHISQDDYNVLIQQLSFISNFNPAEASSLEFKPVGDGFVMTAHFPDGQTASFIVTPLEGGTAFNLVSLNN